METPLLPSPFVFGVYHCVAHRCRHLLCPYAWDVIVLVPNNDTGGEVAVLWVLVYFCFIELVKTPKTDN